MKKSFAVLTLVIALVACGGGERETNAVSENTPAADTTGTWITGETRPPIASTEGGQTVMVTMEDNSIAMPTTLVPGPAVFTVTNAGANDHHLEVEAGGTSVKRLEAPLKPRDTASLNVDLPPGTYTVRCTMEGHQEQIPLTVSNRPEAG
jgi:hypothetical protein